MENHYVGLPREELQTLYLAAIRPFCERAKIRDRKGAIEAISSMLIIKEAMNGKTIPTEPTPTEDPEQVLATRQKLYELLIKKHNL